VDLDSWRIVDVSEWVHFAHNPAGRRRKEWLTAPDGKAWLCKFPLETRPTEPAIEAFTSRLARTVGLVAPETHAGVRGSQSATLVRSFLEDGEELAHGSELLQRRDPTYDPDDHTTHRLDRIRDVLEDRCVDISEFVGLLAFDLWVGNGDRHQENWGIVIAATNARLAPAYDTAACLGVELGDRQLLQAADPVRRRKYVAQCPSGFGDGVRLISQANVVDDLLGWPEWRRDARRWVERFAAALPAASRYLAGVPDEWWPRERRRFAEVMLWRRLVWLWSHLP